MIRTGWFSRGLAAVLLGSALSCVSSNGPTGPAPPANPLLGDLATSTVELTTNTVSGLLLSCRPLPEEVVRQTVGPAGGVIRIGPHRLEIPRGALSQAVTITAEIPPDPVNSIRFAPEGLRFRSSARLTMSYANCDDSILSLKQIAYTTDLLQILELLSSRDNRRAETVSAPVDHFSRYAVAW